MDATENDDKEAEVEAEEEEEEFVGVTVLLRQSTSDIGESLLEEFMSVAIVEALNLSSSSSSTSSSSSSSSAGSSEVVDVAATAMLRSGVSSSAFKVAEAESN